MNNSGSYKDISNEVSELISTIFNVTNNTVSLFYLPYMLKKIHDIAIETASKKRKIKIDNFVEEVKLKAKEMNTVILWDYENARKTVRILSSYLESKFRLKGRKFSYVLQFGKVWTDEDVISLITDLVPLFISEDVRIDNFPLTFGVGKNSEEMVALKKKLMNRVSGNISNYVMNDGYETFLFSPDVFANKLLFLTNKAGNKYTPETSFNYRLSNLDNCNVALPRLDNPFVFCFDTQYEGEDDSRHLQLDGFDIDSIKMLIGGLVR